jgi:predicted nuclease of predicted toxin-antitoxin system
LKLLVDAMFSPAVAIQLRRRAHDVVGASEHQHLWELLDPELFAVAQRENRAIATNNTGDFLRIEQAYRATGLDHFGLILTSDRRFNRNMSGAVGQLVTALDAFLQTQSEPAEPTSLVHWLQ